jgi:hypothetical protein
MHRPLLGMSVCTVALLLAGCGEGGTDSTAALVKAGQALEAKVGAPGAKSEMPGKDDPDVKAFDAEAQKALASLGTETMPVDGLDSYGKLCGSAAKIVGAYASVGVGVNADGSLKVDDPALVETMNKNMARYMDQAFTPLLFSAHCTAVHIPSVDKALDAKPDEKKAAAMNQIRMGAFGQAVGLLQIAGDPSMDSGRRKQALDLAVRDSGNFAIALSKAQRQQLAGAADAVAEADAKAHPQADQIKKAIEAAPCGTLCSL